MSTISIGIDPSLAATGIAVLDSGNIVEVRLIKSKPTKEKTPSDEIQRLIKIKSDIIEILEKYEPAVVCIEGLAFMARNTSALVQLAGLNYMIREYLNEKGIKFIIIAPSTLKKFITGNGAAKKDVMLIEVYKRYGVTILNDNESDAYSLAQCGLALMGQTSKDVPKWQQEVLEIVKKQHDE